MGSGRLKYKNLERLKHALISNACNNQITAFVENFELYQKSVNGTAASNFGNRLVDLALMNLSKDVVEFLLPKGFKCNYASCIYDCKWNRIKDVYNYILEMHDKHGSFTMNTIHLHKGMIINRLIDPEKVSVNKERLVYTIELIRDGFLDASEVKRIADELYKTEKHQGQFKMVSRELILTELGI